jgi:acylphosphatase
VTKSADGKDEIIIQGDVGDEVEEYIHELLEEKGLTEIKVEQVEDKPKKKKQPGA